MLSSTLVNEILKALPHGSGIDSAWKHHTSSRGDVFTNSLHCMNENGYYDGWQDFSVIVFSHKKDVLNPLKGPSLGRTQVLHRKGDSDFKIEFNGQRRQKYIEIWRDAIYDMIHLSLEQFDIGRTRMETIPV